MLVNSYLVELNLWASSIPKLRMLSSRKSLHINAFSWGLGGVSHYQICRFRPLWVTILMQSAAKFQGQNHISEDTTLGLWIPVLISVSFFPKDNSAFGFIAYSSHFSLHSLFFLVLFFYIHRGMGGRAIWRFSFFLRA